MQRELDALRAGRDQAPKDSTPAADLPQQSAAGPLAGLARALGLRKKP